MDISDRIDDPIIVEILQHVSAIASELGIPFFVVGATARDLILRHGFGIEPGRATRDVDLGFRVASWDQYEELRGALTETENFNPIGTGQRLSFRGITHVDVLPFGPIADSQTKIRWQPDEDTELDLTGFDEAFDHAIPVTVSRDPHTEARVASAAGLVLLKIFSWNDRRPKSKDAIDLGILIRSYLQAGNEERLWDEHDDLLHHEDFDFQVAGARILGRDLARICRKETREKILEILDRELDGDGDLPLVVQSAGDNPQVNRTLEFWEAIRAELRSL
ncbi:nucleotidyl transferase AbiEii/AbiGii toxin family protein [Elongatibacter sediminis]|uniref:Nucleotidyl transferase AbiEii/AbiGii toxin family protein n=1 Tax=Elongatibacter sediminis TaxID=3119006 RepID=A0AAW9RH21_9GAMM